MSNSLDNNNVPTTTSTTTNNVGQQSEEQIIVGRGETTPKTTTTATITSSQSIMENASVENEVTSCMEPSKGTNTTTATTTAAAKGDDKMMRRQQQQQQQQNGQYSLNNQQLDTPFTNHYNPTNTGTSSTTIQQRQGDPSSSHTTATTTNNTTVTATNNNGQANATGPTPRHDNRTTASLFFFENNESLLSNNDNDDDDYYLQSDADDGGGGGGSSSVSCESKLDLVGKNNNNNAKIEHHQQQQQHHHHQQQQQQNQVRQTLPNTPLDTSSSSSQSHHHESLETQKQQSQPRHASLETQKQQQQQQQQQQHPPPPPQQPPPPSSFPKQLHHQTTTHRKHHQRKREQLKQRRRSTTTTATIEEDASTAFSPYRPIVPIVSFLSPPPLMDNNTTTTTTAASNTKKKKRTNYKNKEGKSKSDSNAQNDNDKRGGGGGGKSSTSAGGSSGKQRKQSQRRSHPIKSGEQEGAFDRHDSNNTATGSLSEYEYIGSIDATTNKRSRDQDAVSSSWIQKINNVPANKQLLQKNNDATNNVDTMGTDGSSDILLNSIMNTEDDPLLQSYLPQLTFLNDQYYAKIKPFRMGRKNLPSNQLEVVLRRKAIKKREAGKPGSTPGVGTNVSNNAGTTINAGVPVSSVSTAPAGSRTATYGGNNAMPPLPPSSSRRPPSRESQLSSSTSAAPRRTLFPATQHSPPRSHKKAYHEDDDSTISSTTVASTFTATSAAAQSNPAFSIAQSSNGNINPPPATATTLLPKEEIVGDTSLGLKLTILQGKVIIQHITPLDDGRASPAQLCGLISPGDIIIAVNGKTLINGSIQNPVPVDRMFSVLQPLSQPVEEGGQFYAREVRLRFLLGEGKELLREQEEREKKRQEERERMKKLGLDGVRRDPAGDIFSIASFMAVDQHSGMPLFGHSWEDDHTKDEGQEEKEDSNDSVEKMDGEDLEEKSGRTIAYYGEAIEKMLPWFTRAPPAIQAQIAHQVALERQWIRDRHTSRFFTLDNKASLLLRPASPPPPDISENDHSLPMNPIDARKQILERGSQTMNRAKSLVAIVESQDRGLDNSYPDEDPLEVASRVCGTASIRTGASRRRWHRGDSVVMEDAQSSAASSVDNNHLDVSTIRSGESVEACDHRLLVDLAANNVSWKRQVVKRLESYADDTEKESKGGVPSGMVSQLSEEETVPTSLDSLLFGNVSRILNKKKKSLALPPGEMTSMLYDLVEHLDSGLPDQIFMKDDSSTNPVASIDKTMELSKTPGKMNADVKKAKEFLISGALGIWLKTFRPLPWAQRRALWPLHQLGMSAESSMMSSRMDDGMSISMASGSTAPKASEHKRNLREVIMDMELDHETRRETCRLVTFYFTQKFSTEMQKCPADPHVLSWLSQETEAEAAEFIDLYGSYLDIYECIVSAGKAHSKTLIDKLVGVAKYDAHHNEAMKALRKAKVILFYEPHMLSALIGLLPSISTRSFSSNFDFISLLVSAYPDLQPWCVRESSRGKDSETFYFNYLSSLLHHEDGNDSAKRDESLVKEWCLILSSPDETDPHVISNNVSNFFHIASKSDESSIHYHRDLIFLMEVSMNMSEFGLALDLANEIVSNQRYRQDKQTLLELVQHLRTISDVAIEGNEGELNSALLSQVITFFNIISPCMAEHRCEFSIAAELTTLLDQCCIDGLSRGQYSMSSNIDACIIAISENAPPSEYLQVLAQWKHTSVESSSIISALHTSLIRGARKGVNIELSGSLLRIQRAREEGRRPFIENDALTWNAASEESAEEEEEGGFIWPNILDGTLMIAK